MKMSKEFKNRLGIGFSTVLILALVIVVIMLVPVSSAKYVGDKEFNYTLNSNDTQQPWSYTKLNFTSGTTYTVGSTQLAAGKYYFESGNVRYYFEVTEILPKGSTVMLSPNTNNPNESNVTIVKGPDVDGYESLGTIQGDPNGVYEINLGNKTLKAGGKYYYTIGDTSFKFTASESVAANKKLKLKTSLGIVYAPAVDKFVESTDNFVDGGRYMIIPKIENSWKALYYNEAWTNSDTNIKVVEKGAPTSGSYYESENSSVLKSYQYYDVPENDTNNGSRHVVVTKSASYKPMFGSTTNGFNILIETDSSSSNCLCLKTMNLGTGIAKFGANWTAGTTVWNFDGKYIVNPYDKPYLNYNGTNWVITKSSQEFLVFCRTTVYPGFVYTTDVKTTTTITVDFTRFPEQEV